MWKNGIFGDENIFFLTNMFPPHPPQESKPIEDKNIPPKREDFGPGNFFRHPFTLFFLAGPKVYLEGNETIGEELFCHQIYGPNPTIVKFLTLNKLAS